MKKILLLILSFCVFTGTFSSSIIKPVTVKATEIFIPLTKDMKISLSDLSIIKVKDFEKVTGKHLSFMQRLGFKAGQRKLRNSINSNGSVNNKKLLKFIGEGDPSTGFNIGGFALGFFLGAIGVLIAYVIGGDQDIKRNRTKWAWIGLGIVVVLALILFAVALGSLNRIG